MKALNALTVTYPPIISGFTGLGSINFTGSDIVEGFAGVKKRHDFDLNALARFGSWVAVGNANIALHVGIGIKLLRDEGILEARNFVDKVKDT